MAGLQNKQTENTSKTLEKVKKTKLAVVQLKVKLESQRLEG